MKPEILNLAAAGILPLHETRGCGFRNFCGVRCCVRIGVASPRLYIYIYIYSAKNVSVRKAEPKMDEVKRFYMGFRDNEASLFATNTCP